MRSEIIGPDEFDLDESELEADALLADQYWEDAAAEYEAAEEADRKWSEHMETLAVARRDRVTRPGIRRNAPRRPPTV